jgi:hypothetical protein
MGLTSCPHINVFQRGGEEQALMYMREKYEPADQKCPMLDLTTAMERIAIRPAGETCGD